MPSSERSSPGRHYRWIICALLFFATTINYMDRQVLGVLAPYLSRVIGWNDIQYGYIVFAFQAAYALGMGRLIDRIGTRLGYALSIGVWSLSAMGHALASTVGEFITARFMLGLGALVYGQYYLLETSMELEPPEPKDAAPAAAR